MKKSNALEKLHSTSSVSINGSIVSPHEATISIFDRGFLYGDSIYEVTYSEQGTLVFFKEHLDRLYNSASLLNLNIYLSREEIIKQALATLKHSKIPRAYIRIIITRGETQIGLDPSLSTNNNVVIIVKPQEKYPEKLYNEGLKIHIASILRNDIHAINPNAKSGNYLNNVMAISEAKEKGFDDAIMINKHAEVTEGTSFNIWMVTNGVIYTPPSKSGLLKGITRDKVIGICRQNNLALKVESFKEEDILCADEVFITSSTKGIMPVKQMGTKLLGTDTRDWPISTQLRVMYENLIEKELENSEYKYL